MCHRSTPSLAAVALIVGIVVTLGFPVWNTAQPVAAMPAASNLPVADASFGKVPELMYYRFDDAGTTVANQANSPVGTNPAPILGQTIGGSGQFGAALVGNGGSGSTNYVDTGWATNLGTGSWTLSLWTSNVPSSSTLFYFFGDVNANSLRAFTNGVAGTNNMILRGGGMSDVLVSGAVTAQPNVVHFVYDATVPTIRAYKNGVLVNTVNQPALNITGAGPFKVGAYSSSAGVGSGQLLDEFRLYSRALSPEEISATWDRALPLAPAITLTKAVEPVTARPGDAVTYTITFSNTGTAAASNLLITDTLSADITNASFVTSGIALSEVPSTQYAWSAPSLAVKSGGVITITGTLASPRASGTLTNTVFLVTNELTKTAQAPLTVQNLAPVANAGADQTAADQQTVTLNGSNSSDANGDSLTYGWVQTGGPAVQLSSASASSPGFTAPDASAVLTFTLTVTDSLGLVSATADEVVATVTKIVPTLDQPLDATMLEDAGAQTINLAGIGSGGGNAVLSISALSSNPSLIANPSVSYVSPSTSGSLNFTPAADANGTATITVTLQSSDATANGYVRTVKRSFTVAVGAVNDAPNFAAGPNQVIRANVGPQTLAGWATNFTPGPSNEAGQALLGYTVVSNSAPDLFLAAPTINASGTLTYAPKPGAAGTATIGVVVRDNGGTSNGGVDTSVVHTFTISLSADGSYKVYLPLIRHSL